MDTRLTNLPSAGTTARRLHAVGSFPTDCSAYGVLDMCGNALDLVELEDLDEDGRLCGARGGGWHIRSMLCRSAAEGRINRTDRSAYVSFRLVARPG
jgi:formylglycine-generating enzyme required for sulfatase activity